VVTERESVVGRREGGGVERTRAIAYKKDWTPLKGGGRSENGPNKKRGSICSRLKGKTGLVPFGKKGGVRIDSAHKREVTLTWRNLKRKKKEEEAKRRERRGKKRRKRGASISRRGEEKEGRFAPPPAEKEMCTGTGLLRKEGKKIAIR